MPDADVSLELGPDDSTSIALALRWMKNCTSSRLLTLAASTSIGGMPMSNNDDQITMDDYLDGSEPDPPDVENVDVEMDASVCDYCGKRFPKENWGVRASKMRRKHEQRCEERDENE